MDSKMFEAGLLKKHEKANKENEERDRLLKNTGDAKNRIAEVAEIISMEVSSEKKNLNVEQLKKDWENFYKEIGIEANLSDVDIPEKREGFEKLLIMAEGLTPQNIFDKFNELYKKDNNDIAVNASGKDLDKIIMSDRSAKEKAYAIWVIDRIEADKKESYRHGKVEIIIDETLEERLLQGLEFLKRTGKYLDDSISTICVGSCDSNGEVPSVEFRDEKDTDKYSNVNDRYWASITKVYVGLNRSYRRQHMRREAFSPVDSGK